MCIRDSFGEEVEIMDDYYAVAAPGHDAAGIDAGTVILYGRQTGLIQKIMSNPSV